MHSARQSILSSPGSRWFAELAYRRERQYGGASRPMIVNLEAPALMGQHREVGIRVYPEELVHDVLEYALGALAFGDLLVPAIPPPVGWECAGVRQAAIAEHRLRCGDVLLGSSQSLLQCGIQEGQKLTIVASGLLGGGKCISKHHVRVANDSAGAEMATPARGEADVTTPTATLRSAAVEARVSESAAAEAPVAESAAAEAFVVPCPRDDKGADCSSTVDMTSATQSVAAGTDEREVATSAKTAQSQNSARAGSGEAMNSVYDTQRMARLRSLKSLPARQGAAAVQLERATRGAASAEAPRAPAGLTAQQDRLKPMQVFI